MKAETQVEIENFIRTLKPNVDFSEPKYRVGPKDHFSPEQDELEPEIWSAIPKNSRTLIFSRLGELAQAESIRPDYVDDTEVSVRRAVAFGVAESLRTGGIGNPMVAWALAVEARIRCMEGRVDTSNYLMSLAQEVVDLSASKPRLRILVESQIQDIFRKG